MGEYKKEIQVSYYDRTECPDCKKEIYGATVSLSREDFDALIATNKLFEDWKKETYCSICSQADEYRALAKELSAIPFWRVLKRKKLMDKHIEGIPLKYTGKE